MDYGRNFIQRYGCAVVGVALAVSVRLLLDPFLGFAYPFATLFVAILAAAWYGGLGPALTAVVLGGLCAIYFIIPPRGVFFPEGWYQDVGLVLYTCAGIGISLLGGAVDFARRSAEAGNAEARFKSALIEQTYDSILVWDWDGRITFWNGGAERLYGFTQAEAVGRISHELLKTQFPVGFSTFHRKLEADDWWEGELVHTTKDGRVLTVESHTSFTLLTRSKNSREHAVELFNRKVLADVSIRARVESGVHLLFVVPDAGENNDRKRRVGLSHKGNERNSVHFRHLKIDNGHFAVVFRKPGGRLEAIGQSVAGMASLTEIRN